MADHDPYRADLTTNATPATQGYVDECVDRALSRYRMQAAIGFVILFLGILAAGTIERSHNADQRDQIEAQAVASDDRIVKSGDAVAVGGCNRDYATIDALRDQLEVQLLRIDSLVADGTYTPRQGQVAKDSTDDFLNKYKLPDCREAAKVLTAEPAVGVTVPEPRYPDDPQQKASERKEAKKFGKPVNGP